MKPTSKHSLSLFKRLLIVVAALIVFPLILVFGLWAVISLIPRWCFKAIQKQLPKGPTEADTNNTGFTLNFEEVESQENGYIEKRRQQHELPEDSFNRGICISGGGIRSATLGLGALQKLMREDLFKHFDYISTVSGGGYIASCLTSLLSSEVQNNPQDNPSTQNYLQKDQLLAKNSPFLDLNLHILDDDTKDADQAQILTSKDQLHHLRTHGEYLTPNKGLFSRDVRRAFGAFWTGIFYNLGAFITAMVVFVSFCYSILYLLSGGRFFDDVSYPATSVSTDGSNWQYITEVASNWFNDGMKMHFGYVWDALSQHQHSCWMVVLIGFVIAISYFFNIYRSRIRAETAENLNNIDPGETMEYHHDMKWINRFMWTSIIFGSIVPFFVVVIINTTPLPYYGADQINYWVCFAWSISYGLGILLGTFSYQLLMEAIKYFMLPYFSLLRNHKGKNNWQGLLYRLASRVSIKMYYRDFRSLIRSFQGQAAYFLIIMLLLPILLASVFSIYFSWKFIVALLSVAVVSYAINGQFGAGNSIINRAVNAIRNPLLLVAVLLAILLVFNGITRQIIHYNDDAGEYQLYSVTYSNDNGFDLIFPNEGSSTVSASPSDTIGLLLNLNQADKIPVQKKQWKVVAPSQLEVSPINDLSPSQLLITAPADLMMTGKSDTLQLAIYHPALCKSGLILFDNFKVDKTTPLLLFGALLLLVIIGPLANANKFSLHYFYRDRLSEAYLRTTGRADRTNPMHKQGLPLRVLRNHDNIFLQQTNDHFLGPYHIIVAALNLQGSNDLVRKALKSEHFIFSKYFVGSNSTGYVSTEKYRKGKTTLAIAMTISAAAVASSMGRMSFAAQNFFMTLFNLRTGYWIENPWYYRTQKEQNWMNQDWKFFTITFWLKYLFYEMWGSTNARKRRVNVSDGGFTGDNLGLVPLLRRKCSTIVVCDFEEDGGYNFESFYHAVRIAYVDYNIEVKIDLDDLIPVPGEGGLAQSKKSYAKGEIIYHNSKKGSSKTPKTGTLIYLKSTISPQEAESKDDRSGKIPVAVYTYSKQHPKFPHEPTVDQYFNDAQFEAYRALGYHMAKQICPILKTEINPPDNAKSDEQTNGRKE